LNCCTWLNSLHAAARGESKKAENSKRQH
jgi:hypothetical protein